MGSNKAAAVCPTHLEHCSLACAHHHTTPHHTPGRSVSSRSGSCQESQSARKGTWPATATAAVRGLCVTHIPPQVGARTDLLLDTLLTHDGQAQMGALVGHCIHVVIHCHNQHPAAAQLNHLRAGTGSSNNHHVPGSSQRCLFPDTPCACACILHASASPACQQAVCAALPTCLPPASLTADSAVQSQSWSVSANTPTLPIVSTDPTHWWWLSAKWQPSPPSGHGRACRRPGRACGRQVPC